MEYSDDKFVAITTIVFDVFLVAFGIMGCYFDYSNKLHMNDDSSVSGGSSSGG